MQVISETAAKYLRFHLADHVGPITLGKLLERFGGIDALLSASPSEISGIEGIGRARLDAILRAGENGQADLEIQRAQDHGVRIICLEDAEYPPQLRHINDPPSCLYVRGTLERADALGVAVVGSRRCTLYGSEQARRFSTSLAAAGFTVMSGLARGIDGHAHEAALEVGGRTIAVLGNGLGSIYPPEHAGLADRVAASGAVVSELPMETSSNAINFPKRNRIIAGLSLGVLVVEASRRSGALISARMASEYNREVFAVPGRLDVDTAVGSNSLIQAGQAKLVTRLEDILDELGEVGQLMQPDPKSSIDYAPEGTSPVPSMTREERSIYEAIGEQHADIDSMSTQSGLNVGQVSAILTGLQLKGVVRRLPGNLYAHQR